MLGLQRKIGIHNAFAPLLFCSLIFIPYDHAWGRKVRSHTTKTENPVPQSFFAPKPNGIACYAGWGVTFQLVTLSYHYHYYYYYCSFSQLALRRTLTQYVLFRVK